MSYSEAYLLASRVKTRLGEEALKSDINLLRLVCQANLLDNLILSLNKLPNHPFHSYESIDTIDIEVYTSESGSDSESSSSDDDSDEEFSDTDDDYSGKTNSAPLTDLLAAVSIQSIEYDSESDSDSDDDSFDEQCNCSLVRMNSQDIPSKSIDFPEKIISYSF